MLNYIAENLIEDKYKESYIERFIFLDRDNDGYITKEDLIRNCQQ